MIVKGHVHQQKQCEKAKEVENGIWSVSKPPPFESSWVHSVLLQKRIRRKSKSAQFTFGETLRSAQTTDSTIFDKSHVYSLRQPRSKFADSCDPEIIDGPEENNITEALLSHTCFISWPRSGESIA